jgi:hypothetical protein
MHVYVMRKYAGLIIHSRSSKDAQAHPWLSIQDGPMQDGKSDWAAEQLSSPAWL